MKRILIVLAAGLVWPLVAAAQQSAQTVPKKKSPAEIAAASQDLAEKNEACRRQAKAEKLTGLKRFRFVRDCRKAK
jgi:hypothetical protein